MGGRCCGRDKVDMIADKPRQVTLPLWRVHQAFMCTDINQCKCSVNRRYGGDRGWTEKGQVMTHQEHFSLISELHYCNSSSGKYLLRLNVPIPLYKTGIFNFRISKIIRCIELSGMMLASYFQKEGSHYWYLLKHHEQSKNAQCFPVRIKYFTSYSIEIW